MQCMPQGAYIANPCYVGTSLVSTQGDTVISKFFAYSAAACTKWSIDTFKASSGEVYKTKDNNNYSFYQVHLP